MRAGSTAVGGAASGKGATAEPASGASEAARPVHTDVDQLIGVHPRRWLGLAGAWLTVAFSVGFGLFVNYQAQGRGISFGSTLMAMIPHYSFWVLVSPALYRSLHMTIQGRNRALWLSMLFGWSAIALAGSTAMSYFSYVIRHDLEPTLERLIGIYVLPPAGPSYWAMNLSILALALVAFAAVRNQRLRDQALWSAARTELGLARLEAQLADARLQALQAQMNPHFMLNSLNAIAGLVQIGDRDRAFDAIARLGELMQMALQNGRGLHMTLGDEVDFLQRYLKLCKLRFDSCFNYFVSVPESLRSRRIPGLMVQPLIENAIRHGMEPPRALNVEIRAYARGPATVIEVEDDGRGIAAAGGHDLPAGHGLANIRERLQLCFGAAGQLSVEPRVPRGTRARIVIG
jgi:signal transduction histidine kinase